VTPSKWLVRTLWTAVVFLARGQQPNPHEFFGTAFWIGFTLHLIAAEAWINYTRPAMQASTA